MASGLAGYRILAPDAFGAEDTITLDRGLKRLSRWSADSISFYSAPYTRIASFGSEMEDRAPPGDETAPGAVAGDPVYTDSAAPVARQQSRQRLLAAVTQSGAAGLAGAKGVFALACIDASGRLVVAADRFGLRPVYAFKDGPLFAFATSLRVLLAMLGGRAHLSREHAGMVLLSGALIGRAVPYRGIERLRGGEAYFVTAEKAMRKEWTQWPAETDEQRAYADSLAGIRHHVTAAVERRSCRETELAALSGGLDSRLVVAALRDLGRQVTTLALAAPQTYDYPLSIAAAKALGTHHHIYAADVNTAFVDADFAEVCAANLPGDARAPFFTGDGGSVLMGHVYMTAESVARFAEAAPERLAKEEMRAYPRAILDLYGSKAEAESIARHMRAALEAEFANLQGIAPERRQFHFLLRGNQARHLDGYFEDIDRHRAEPVLPFFDADLVEAIYRTPIAHMLGHRLYNDLIAAISPAAASVAWQAYPGHLPSPVPLPDGVQSQWERDPDLPAAYRRRRRAQLRRLADEGAGLGISRWQLGKQAIRLHLPLGGRRPWIVERLASLARLAALEEPPEDLRLPVSLLGAYVPGA